jgi:O-antigen/teichoic acid export membrane protein
VVRKNAIANYLGQAWTALMGFAFVPAYIRYLGIEAYGIVGLLAAIQAWLVLLDMGLAPTMAREMARFTARTRSASEIRNLLRSVEAISGTVAVFIALGFYLGSDWIATSWLRLEHLPVATVREGIVVVGLVAACRFFETIYRSSVIGLQMQVSLNVASALFATIRGIGALGVLAWLSPTLPAFFAWQALASVGSVLLLAWLTYNALPPVERPVRITPSAIRNVAAFAGGMLGISALSLLLTNLDKLLLSRLLPLTHYGYYTLAATVAGALFMFVAPVTQAIYPRLTQLHSADDQVSMAAVYHRGAQATSIVCGSTALTLAIFSHTILGAWTHNPELSRNVAPLLSLLAIGNLANAIMWVPYQAQLAHGWTRLTMGLNSVGVVVCVPALFVATSQFGAIGAAWIWLLLNVFYVLVGVQLMHRRILRGQAMRWYWDDVGKPLLAAFVPVYLAEMLAQRVDGLPWQAGIAAAAFLASVLCSTAACVELRLSVVQLFRRSPVC